MKEIWLYTDGACSGNPGIGGWCAILFYKNNEKVLSGGEKLTTNNVMEISAVINGLQALKEKCFVKIYSDSAYVVNAFLNGWVFAWEKNGWKTASKESVKNRELWEKLLELSRFHSVEFNKVKGHSDDEINNRCDEYARAEIVKIRNNLS